MYVCICNAIRECELRKAARACAGDIDSVYASLGKTPQCAQCLDEATDILIEERFAAKADSFQLA
jgi:bacterioferritin-associated ferredoxin